MPHHGRIVGIDVSKRKVDACIRSVQRWLSAPSTPQGEDELIAWLRELIVILNTMLARGQMWNPPAAALAACIT